MQFAHSHRKIQLAIEEVKQATPRKTKSNDKNKKNTSNREKRQQWKPNEFNHLRALSLLGYKRKLMANELYRDDRLIFSKL